MSVDLELARLLSPDSKRAASGDLSEFSGGYGYARQAISLEMVEAVADRLFEGLSACEGGPTVVALDGSSLSPDGSPSLHEVFPGCTNQSGRSHFPCVKFVVAHDVYSGMAVRPEVGAMYGPHAVSEQALATRLLARLPEDCVVLADRNFGIFSVAWQVVASGRKCVLRMTESRAASLLGRGADLNCTGQWPLVWRPSKADLRGSAKAKAGCALEGRLVIQYVQAPASQKPVRLCLFVCGLDESPEQLAELYLRRWSIETDLRTLKKDLHMDRLNARTPDTLLKELILGFCAYNLVRSLSKSAAMHVGVPARQISYTRMSACIKAYGPRLAAEQDPGRRMALVNEMFERGAARLNKPRNRPSQPRQAWYRRRDYPARKIQPSKN